MTPAIVLFWVAAPLYALATVLYMGFLAGGPQSASRAARLALLAAFIAHFLEIGARGIAGFHPVSSTSEAIGFLAFLLVGAFLLSQVKRPLDAVGAFVAPVALIFLVVAYVSPDRAMGTTEGLGVLGRLHIGLATVGVSIFALATGLAAFYLVQERQLKHKKMGRAVKRGAALETLDTFLHRTALVGFPIFTVALISGALWTAQRGEGLRIEYPLAALAWAAFGALLVARRTAGWRGRKAAVLAIAGFLAALLVLLAYVARAAGVL